MTSALLRWEAEVVGGERGHGTGGLLAAVANVGALAVICPEVKKHEPALPATSCSLQTPGLVSTTTSHKSKRAVVSAHLDKTCEPAQTQLKPTVATNRKSQLLTGSIISMAASRKHANML